MLSSKAHGQSGMCPRLKSAQWQIRYVTDRFVNMTVNVDLPREILVNEKSNVEI